MIYLTDKENGIKYGVDIDSNHDSFCFVDLPGFGCAKVPEEQHLNWMHFKCNYLSMCAAKFAHRFSFDGTVLILKQIGVSGNG
jgi:GTP-binding protein EngB required for normal cell division